MSAGSAESQLRQICDELERRVRDGERQVAEQLLAKHPELVANVDSALELIYREFVTLDELGERPTVGDLARRFPQWKNEIQKLLEVHQAFGADDGQPARTIPLATVGIGTMIGRYQLLQEIGVGGFGVVYMAEQSEPVRRKVAVKIVKPGMDTREVVARFEAERQTLSMMDHPNIAKMLDGGATDNGRPYFVMELVKGVPITEYCDRNSLSTVERLKLLQTVCHAVQHAHHKGVVHRDLKPSNVMITLHEGEPVPKVIDFGVSKALNQQLTAKTLFTRYGQMVGTPQYMSPEQAEMSGLDIDTRSDVYSLGVLLYELLTGTTPLSSERLRTAAFADIVRMIKDEEPLRPSARLTTLGDELTTICNQRKTDRKGLQTSIRGDLDWIVMKSLEKDRRRRYETASSLARDIEHFLCQEPVHARPPSNVYRFQKFVRRNRRTLLLWGIAASALLIAVGTIAGSMGWAARERAAQQAELQNEASRALQDAEHLRVEGSYSEALAEVKRAESLLASADSASLRQSALAVRTDLEMVARLEEIRLLQGDPRFFEPVYEVADPAYTLAFRQYGLDLPQMVPTVAAERIRSSAIREQLITALDDWAWIKPDTDRSGREHLWVVARLADPDDWRNNLRDPSVARNRQTLEQLASEPMAALLPPTTAVLLGRMLYLVGATEKAISVLSAAQARHPDDLWLNLELSELLLWRVVPPRQSLAIEYARAALAARPQSARLLVTLGNALRSPGRRDEELACYRRAIELQPGYAESYKALGFALAEQGSWDAAIEAYHEGIRLAPTMTNTHLYLAVAHRRTGQWDKAIEALKEATRLIPGDARSHAQLAWDLANHPNLTSRDPKRALEQARKAIKLGPRNSKAWEALGAAYYRDGQFIQGANALRRAIRANWGKPTPQISLFLAMCEQQRGQHELASRHFQEAQSWLTWYRERSPVTAGEATELAGILAESREMMGHNASAPLPADSPKIDSPIRWTDAQLLAVAKASEGRLFLQMDMRDLFGPSWSGGQQLVWVAKRPAARLVLTVQVDQAGDYSVIGALTKAHDYGRFQLHVNGKPVGTPFDGFNRGPYPDVVIYSGPIVLGRARFEAGRNEMTFEIIGKHFNSVDYLVGIDELGLMPVAVAD
jgi:serine/threonine-protein kinase